jgi:adenosylcobyric acid synthase
MDGYEIHHGATTAGPAAAVTLTGPDGPVGWRSGNVRASYVHGLLEHAGYRDALLGRAGIVPGEATDGLDARLSAIAFHVRAALDWPRVRALVA